MQIGERLFNLRQKSGESLQQVADATGMSKAHVWDLEKGRSKNPAFELVRKLADHFNVSIDVLVGDEPEPTAKAQQVDRIHRELGNMTDRDRQIIEQMIRSMQKSTDTES